MRFDGSGRLAARLARVNRIVRTNALDWFVVRAHDAIRRARRFATPVEPHRGFLLFS